jgi:hypothetical protein
MAEHEYSSFNIVYLNTLSRRLVEAADSITDYRQHHIELDLRFAARVCHALAGLRFGVAEIAERALTEDGGVIRRDLLEALVAAEA